MSEYNIKTIFCANFYFKSAYNSQIKHKIYVCICIFACQSEQYFINFKIKVYYKDDYEKSFLKKKIDSRVR